MYNCNVTVKNSIFGTKAFYKQALLISLPVILQNLVQNLVNLIDNFMVAGLGDIKMSGVNIAGQMIFVFAVICNAVCMSGGIFVTQFFGAGDEDGMKQSICFKGIVSFIVAAIYIFVCLVAPRQILSIMVKGNSEAAVILDEGVKYMRVMSLIGIFMPISYIFSSSLKETGRVRFPLIASLIAAAVNMVFNYLLIYGNLGAPKLEVVGAAIATVIARFVEMIIYYIYLKRDNSPLLVSVKDYLHINKKLFIEMTRKSFMIIFSELLWVICETVTTALYNGRGGADVVSGMAASFTIANLYFVAFGGVTVATSVMIGKLLGEGNLEEAKQCKTWIYSGSTIFGMVTLGIGLLTTLLVPILYGSLSLSSQTLCRDMVFYMALFMPVWIFLNVELAISRAGGDTKMAFIIDGLGNLFVVIPLVFYLAKCTSVGPVGIYIISKLVDVIKIALCYFWLRKEKWLVNLTVKKES